MSENDNENIQDYDQSSSQQYHHDHYHHRQQQENHLANHISHLSIQSNHKSLFRDEVSKSVAHWGIRDQINQASQRYNNNYNDQGYQIREQSSSLQGLQEIDQGRLNVIDVGLIDQMEQKDITPQYDGQNLNFNSSQFYQQQQALPQEYAHHFQQQFTDNPPDLNEFQNNISQYNCDITRNEDDLKLQYQLQSNSNNNNNQQSYNTLIRNAQIGDLQSHTINRQHTAFNKQSIPGFDDNYSLLFIYDSQANHGQDLLDFDDITNNQQSIMFNHSPPRINTLQNQSYDATNEDIQRLNQSQLTNDYEGRSYITEQPNSNQHPNCQNFQSLPFNQNNIGRAYQQSHHINSTPQYTRNNQMLQAQKDQPLIQSCQFELLDADKDQCLQHDPKSEPYFLQNNHPEDSEINDQLEPQSNNQEQLIINEQQPTVNHNNQPVETQPTEGNIEQLAELQRQTYYSGNLDQKFNAFQTDQLPICSQIIQTNYTSFNSSFYVHRRDFSSIDIVQNQSSTGIPNSSYEYLQTYPSQKMKEILRINSYQQSEENVQLTSNSNCNNTYYDQQEQTNSIHQNSFITYTANINNTHITVSSQQIENQRDEEMQSDSDPPSKPSTKEGYYKTAFLILQKDIDNFKSKLFVENYPDLADYQQLFTLSEDISKIYSLKEQKDHLFQITKEHNIPTDLIIPFLEKDDNDPKKFKQKLIDLKKNLKDKPDLKSVISTINNSIIFNKESYKMFLVQLIRAGINCNNQRKICQYIQYFSYFKETNENNFSQGFYEILQKRPLNNKSVEVEERQIKDKGIDICQELYGNKTKKKRNRKKK